MILVDALNLIHAVPRLRELLRAAGLQAAERELIRVCSQFVLLGVSREIVLVFDGNRPQGAPTTPPVPGLFTRYVPNADADLMDLLSRQGDHLLVTADAELVARAPRHEPPAGWFQGVEDFVAHAADGAYKQHAPSPHEVGEWLEMFGEAPPKPTKPKGGLAPEQVSDWLEYFGEG